MVVGPGVGVVGVSTVELGLRMAVGLAVIVGLLWLVVRVGRGRRGGDGPLFVVRAQQQVAKQVSLAVVSTGGQDLLVSIAPTGVTLLTATPTQPATTNNPTPTGTGATTAGGATPACGATTTGTAGAGGAIDIRTKPNPLKQLQNKTVRRG